jgi:6-phosphogluconolactonase
VSAARTVVHADAEALARAAALEVARAAREGVAQRGRFDLALAGGSTPRRLYQLLDSRELPEASVPWRHVHVWFGDERCVPPDHADSNYRMVREALLERVGIQASNVHRMRGEDEPAAAARAYELELSAQFELPPPRRGGRVPSFDLVLLGLGPDGHTASLFPATKALTEPDRWCAANWIEAKQSWRLTLTYPVLDAARRVLFLVAGADKREMLARVRAKADPTLPASLVGTAHDPAIVEWWLDQDSSS